MKQNELTHQAVLTREVEAGLAVQSEGIYLDATFGRGGHSAAILENLGPHGQLLSFDRDPVAVRYARDHFGHDPRFDIEHGRFSTLGEALARRGWNGKVAGIIFDLGVATPQLDDPVRGFSFRHSGPLDMRMDPTTGINVAQWLARASATDIAQVVREWGEERYAARIARAILTARQVQTIATTGELAAIVAAAVPHWEQDKHPATRTFQALRILINDELEELRQGLAAAADNLASGGRLAVISFHSLEDRIVKRFMRADQECLPRDLPIPAQDCPQRWRILGRLIRPDAAEIAENPRARSARLRIAEKL